MFDPYHRWLGIPPEHRPPTYYQLLGIGPAERDQDVIEEAAIRQTTHVRTYQVGPHARESTKLLNEIAQARATLLDPAKRREYDARLVQQAIRQAIQEQPAPRRPVATPLPPPSRLPATAPPLPEDGFADAPFSFDAPPSTPVSATRTEPIVRRSPQRRARSRGRRPAWLVPAAIGALGLILGVALTIWLGGTRKQDDPLTRRSDRGQGEEPGRPQGGANAAEPEEAKANGWTSGASTEGVMVRCNGHTDEVRSVVFSPDSDRILSGGSDKTVRLWNATTGNQVRLFSGHIGLVWGVAFSPDGHRALSASQDNTVRVWNVDTGKELHALNGHIDYVRSVAFFPNGKRALSGSWDKTVRLWDVDSGQELGWFLGHPGPVRSVAVSPNGKWALSSGQDTLLRLWDAASGGQLLKTFQGHDSAVNSVAFSPDNSRALSGSWDETVRLWDVASGKELKKLTGHTGPVWSVAFSPDGRYALSGSDDKSVRVWDLAKGKTVFIYQGHEGPVQSVACSPKARLGLSAGADKTIRLWGMPSFKTP